MVSGSSLSSLAMEVQWWTTACVESKRVLYTIRPPVMKNSNSLYEIETYPSISERMAVYVSTDVVIPCVVILLLYVDL